LKKIDDGEFRSENGLRLMIMMMIIYDERLMMMKKEFGMIIIVGGNNDNSARRMKGFEGRVKVKREERHYGFPLEKSTFFFNSIEFYRIFCWVYVCWVNR
jgi:hypothetical protein